MNSKLFDSTDEVPRSYEYRGKQIKSECYVDIKGTRYFKRVFFDNSVELVRYDNNAKKWVFLLFI